MGDIIKLNSAASIRIFFPPFYASLRFPFPQVQLPDVELPGVPVVELPVVTTIMASTS